MEKCMTGIYLFLGIQFSHHFLFLFATWVEWKTKLLSVPSPMKVVVGKKPQSTNFKLFPKNFTSTSFHQKANYSKFLIVSNPKPSRNQTANDPKGN